MTWDGFRFVDTKKPPSGKKGGKGKSGKKGDGGGS